MRWRSRSPAQATGIAGSLGAGEIADMAVMARDAAIEKKDVLKAALHLEPRRVRATEMLYHDVSDADRAAEVSWVWKCDGPGQAVCALRITARTVFRSVLGLGESLDIALNALPIAMEGAGTVNDARVVRERQNDTLV